jgi:hypothetical protein
LVLDAAGIGKSRIDFILFDRQRVTFVRVKRSHSRIITAGELAIRFHGDISEIRKVPLTPVVSRELWILLPWGSWQYFCIGDDTITEIVEERGKVFGTSLDLAVVQGKLANQPQSWKPKPGSCATGPGGAGTPEVSSPGP